MYVLKSALVNVRTQISRQHYRVIQTHIYQGFVMDYSEKVVCNFQYLKYLKLNQDYFSMSYIW